MAIGRKWHSFVLAFVGTALIALIGNCASGGTSMPAVTALSPTATPTVAPAKVLPTAIPMPRPTPTSPPAATEVPYPTETAISTVEIVEVRPVTLTIVYDNNPYDPRLRTAWGFACLVETSGTTVLFDTGGDGPTLLGNMEALGIKLQAIDAVVLSHIHGDHTGGLMALLSEGIMPTVFVPAAFPAGFKDSVRARTELMEVTGSAELFPGVWTTGELGSGIIEQALAIESDDGVIVITGCAHPGVVEMVRRAKEMLREPVALVMGGFHLGSASQSRISGIIDAFHEMGVHRVAPCHCTGDRARSMFAAAYGPGYIAAGVGRVIIVSGEPGKP